MEWFTGVFSGVNPAEYRPEVDEEQILPWGDHLSLYPLNPSLFFSLDPTYLASVPWSSFYRLRGYHSAREVREGF